MNKNLETIRSSLNKLAQSDSDNAFVVFSDKQTGRFLQFAGSRQQNLLLDLPTQMLSPDEFETAQAVFKEYGTDLEASPLLDKPGGEVVDAHFGFNLSFGKEVDAAARVAHYIMLTVFELKDNFELSVEEN